MTESKKTRPSAADRNLKCSGSLLKCKFPVDAKSDDARDGQAKHVVAARYVAGTLTRGDFKNYADYYQVDAQEIEQAALVVKGMWEKLKVHFPNVKIEQKLSGVASEGTEDVVSFEGAALLDWKFGWSFNEHPNQLLAYADGLLVALNEKMPECGYIKGFEVWARHKEYREYKFTKAAIEGYRDRMLYQIKNAGQQYNPGDHCGFCPNTNDCEARLQHIRTTAIALAEAPEEGIQFGRDDYGVFYDRVSLIKKQIKKYEEGLNGELKDGPIQIDGGREIALIKQKTTSIFVDKAWPILTKKYGYTKDEMARCINMKKEAMESIVKERAEKGKGAKVARALIKDLKDADAIWEGSKEVRRVRSIK